MQFVIETGPVVDGRNVGLTLSNKHHRRLVNILYDWYWLLPNEIRYHVKKIQAIPSTQQFPSIRIEVTLTGNYERRAGSIETGGTRTWRSSFSYSFPYRDQYATDNHYKPDCFDSNLPERLTARLLEDLEKEYEASRTLYQNLSTLLEAMRVREASTT